MNILMMTNTYTPLVGRLERSVREFTMEFRRRGHRAVIVAPVFEGMPNDEEDVIRVPAIQHFNGSDFAVKLPMPPTVTRLLVRFRPDVIHAHHPFLIGNTALRLAHTHKIPLVFTHHTLFEQYTHYLPTETPTTERFVVELATGYANMCDRVFAPSQSVARLLWQRGVEAPITVVPTGVDIPRFSRGDRLRGRRALGLPNDALVIGHVGRLAPEKNLGFLADAVAQFLRRAPNARFLVVGSGPSEQDIRHACKQERVEPQLKMAGVLKGQALIDAYHAMDVFVFASKSETQGLVVAEAMAARVPVIAIDAPGVREVVEDGRNGRLLPSEDRAAFITALREFAALTPTQRQAMANLARHTAEQLAMPRCAELALRHYADMLVQGYRRRQRHQGKWWTALRRVRAEWDVLKTVTKATAVAVKETRKPQPAFARRRSLRAR